MKKQRVSPEIKEEILGQIKDDGMTVSEVARERGIPESTIHTWIAKKADGPSAGDMLKLKRENDQLKILLGEITLKLSETQKKK